MALDSLVPNSILCLRKKDWPPAILRSYDIAGIRVGARPVYAVQSADDTVEVVWQELVNFNPVTSGKMIIQVEEKGMTASRGAGDTASGFGSISMTPLQGEDILVRRLADAASQAIEKGLAVKVSHIHARVSIDTFSNTAYFRSSLKIS